MRPSVDRPRSPRGGRNPLPPAPAGENATVITKEKEVIHTTAIVSHYHDERYLRLDGNNSMAGNLSFSGGDHSIVAPPGRNLDIRLGDDAGNNYITFSNSSGSPLAHMSSLGGWLVTALTCVGDLDVAQLNARQVVYSPDDSGHLSGSDEFTFNPDSHLVTVPGLIVSDLAAGRVPYVGAGGRITSASGLTYASNTLTAPNLAASGLTATRIPIVTTGGKLTDSADLTYASNTLSLAGNLSFTGAARTISSASGYNLNLKLGDAGGANKLSIQTSGGITICEIDSQGRMALGVGMSVDSGINIYAHRTNTVTGSEDRTTIKASQYASPSGSTTAYTRALHCFSMTTAASTGNMSGLQNFKLELYHFGSGTVGGLYGQEHIIYGRGAGPVTTAKGIYLQLLQSTGSTSASTWGNVHGIHSYIGTNAGAGRITNAYHYYLTGVASGGAVTNVYGIYLDSSFAVGTSANYAIYNASTAPIYSAGDIQLASGKVLKVGGVQVVGSRQSAIANVTVTGTAEDGTARAAINAILAALRAHGLIAT